MKKRTAVIAVLIVAALAADVAMIAAWRGSYATIRQGESRFAGFALGYASLPGRLRVYIARWSPPPSITWGQINMCSMGERSGLPLNAGRGITRNGVHITGHYFAFILLIHFTLTTPAGILWLRSRSFSRSGGQS